MSDRCKRCGRWSSLDNRECDFLFFKICFSIVLWRLHDLHGFQEVSNLCRFINCTFSSKCSIYFRVDSFFLLAFQRLWVGVWQHIITENNRLQENFGLPPKLRTIMINAGSCPKYYFQNDKYLFNMEDKASLDIILKEKQNKNSSASIYTPQCWWLYKTQLSWELQSERRSVSSLVHVWPSGQCKLLVILVLSWL